MTEKQWYVRYPDGERSIKMTHHRAQVLARIFKGEVVEVMPQEEGCFMTILKARISFNLWEFLIVIGVLCWLVARLAQ